MKASKTISAKLRWRELLALLALLIAIVFFRAEQREMHSIVSHLQTAEPVWLTVGLLVVAVYCLLQAGMYSRSFAAVNLHLSWRDALMLFLKRNFIGVFLPAGSVSALAYSPAHLRRQGYTTWQVYQASGLNSFAGLLTVFLAGLPVMLYALLGSHHFASAWLGLLLLSAIIVVIVLAAASLQGKKKLYRWIVKKFPQASALLDQLFSANVNLRVFSGTVLLSLGVELCGIVHVCVAMRALGLPISIGACAITYIVAVLLMIVSPFLRGLGAVELSMVYVLGQFGYSAAEALAITVLFRLFEFWSPLVLGLFAFLWRGRRLFLRVAPALLCLLLGVINVVSVITPPVHQRLRLLAAYLPWSSMHASNLLVLFAGLALLVTSAFLVRGSRTAWAIALALATLSLLGHLTKALDYEEAAFAGLTLLALMGTSDQYRVQSNKKWMQAGIKTAVASLLGVLVFGFVSFYFLDKRHFGIDFSWRSSLLHTLKNFLLLDDAALQPVTRFGKEFIWLIRALGVLTWSFLLYTLVRPRLIDGNAASEDRQRAQAIAEQYGASSLDYFKLLRDKSYFFSAVHEAFIAYRPVRNFAIVLEEPVCAAENKLDVLREFEQYCRDIGLTTVYYQVGESVQPLFSQLNKQHLMIGQEASLAVCRFGLEGKEKKSSRNGLSNLKNKGYRTEVLRAPHSQELVLRLQAVSSDWLQQLHRRELGFSQGVFDAAAIRSHDVVVLYDDGGEIKAFLNIIPDYAEGECTYDLVRKTHDAPAAAMDGLMIALIDYARDQHKAFLNLGLVPMWGITRPDNTAEQLIRLAAARIRRFHYYKGLREFKEKYATHWENRYLIYSNDFDLLQLPAALRVAMTPGRDKNRASKKLENNMSTILVDL